MDERWPNLYLIGAPKSGTRALEHAFARHPEIYVCPVAAPLYFADLGIEERWLRFFDVVTDRSKYLRLFAAAKDERFLVDASANYLFFPDALRRIREVSPHAKAVAVLRDPVERAYSHYLNDVREGLERRTFAEAVTDQIAHPERQPWPSRYVEYGRYSRALETALEVFGEDLHVLFFEEMVAEPEPVLRRLFEWLGVPAYGDALDVEHRNPAGRPRNPVAARSLGSPTVRRIARALVPHRGRPAARKLLVAPGAEPLVDPEVRGLLLQTYAREGTLVAALTGRRPPWPPELFGSM